MRKVKKDDQVVVLTGKDKGKKGRILKILEPKISSKKRNLAVRVLVEGVNMIKKHMKPNPQKEVTGGIVEKEAPLDISNVALFNAKENKPS